VRAGEEGQAEKSERNTVDGEWADEPADEVGRRRVSERRGEAIRDIYTVNTWQREKTGRTPKTALSTVREERKKKKDISVPEFPPGPPLSDFRGLGHRSSIHDLLFERGSKGRARRGFVDQRIVHRAQRRVHSLFRSVARALKYRGTERP